MAVTIDRASLAVELRIATATTEDLPEGQGVVLDRLLSTATALVTNYAPNAPDAIHDEALIRVAGWLYDTDPAEARRATSPVQHSGASSLLAPYRVRRLAGVSGVVEPVGPTVIPTDAAAVQALIDAHAAIPDAHHEKTALPAPGLDAAAVQALVDAHAALPNAHHTPPAVAPDGFTPLAAGATAVGNHTVTGWRDFDWLAGVLIADGGERYAFAIATPLLLDDEISRVSLEQNVEMRLTPTAGDDVIAVTTGGSLSGTGAGNTITWLGWNGSVTAGTPTPGGAGVDQTARTAAAAAQTDADDALSRHRRARRHLLDRRRAYGSRGHAAGRHRRHRHQQHGRGRDAGFRRHARADRGHLPARRRLDSRRSPAPNLQVDGHRLGGDVHACRDTGRGASRAWRTARHADPGRLHR